MALTLDYHQHVVLVKLNLCPPEYQDWKENSFLSRITPLCRRFLLKAGSLRFLPVYLNRILRRLRNIVLGFVVTSVILTVLFEGIQTSDNQTYRSTNTENTNFKIVPNEGYKEERTWLYVGVLSAGHFLKNRARHVWNTWGNRSQFLEVFTGTGEDIEEDFPVVQLSGIDETEYPPQHKSFAMLRFMCEHRSDDFDWYMRADDDVYVKMERLHSLLRTLDSNEAIYLGQSGYGRTETQNTLGLEGHSFCMGGPGVILSRTAMKGLCRVLSTCQLNVISSEEDVEIGRCMHQLGLQCTRAKQKAKSLVDGLNKYNKHLACLNGTLSNLPLPEAGENTSAWQPSEFPPDIHGNETHACLHSHCLQHDEWLPFIHKVKQQLATESNVRNLMISPSQLKAATMQFKLTAAHILFQISWTNDQMTNRSLSGILTIQI